MIQKDKHGNYITRSQTAQQNYLKSINLGLTDFHIQIADFGFSKKLEDAEQMSKTVCGTPLYMSP